MLIFAFVKGWLHIFQNLLEKVNRERETCPGWMGGGRLQLGRGVNPFLAPA